jgi:hypothetical protein
MLPSQHHGGVHAVCTCVGTRDSSCAFEPCKVGVLCLADKPSMGCAAAASGVSADDRSQSQGQDHRAAHREGRDYSLNIEHAIFTAMMHVATYRPYKTSK